MTIDDDLLRLGDVPAGADPIRPLGQIRLRADELRRSRRRRSVAGGTASVAGVGVLTLVVTGLPGTLLGSAPTPNIGVGGPRTVPPCEIDPTSTVTPTPSGTGSPTPATPTPAPPGTTTTSGLPPVSPVSPTGSAPPDPSPSLIVTSQPGDPSPSLIVTSQPGDPSSSPVTSGPPSTDAPGAGPTVITPTATPVPADPGVPWKRAPQLIHLVGTQRPVEARMDVLPPADCRSLPQTVAAGADRGPNGTVRAAIAVDGPWPRMPDLLPELQQQVALRGTRGTLAHWRPEVIDSRGTLVLAWLEPGTRQWWQVRSSGLPAQQLVAAATGLDLRRPAVTLPQRFTGLPLQRQSAKASHRWEALYRTGQDRIDTLWVWDGADDDGPFARLADIQADRVRLVDVAGGLAFWLPHDNGDSPSVYLVKDGLTFQYLSADYPGSVKALKGIEHVRPDDPRLKGVKRQFP